MFEQAFKNIDDVLRKEAGCTTELDYIEQTSWILFLKYLDALEQDRATEAELNRKKYSFLLDKPYRWETWAASRKESRIPRTVVLKLKTSDFGILTRSHTPPSPPSSCEELTSIALSLRDRVGLSPHQRFRLVGVGLSNFRDPDDASAQPDLFD